MSDFASVLRALGQILPLAGDGPPPVDPEALAAAHLRRSQGDSGEGKGTYAQLFSPDAAPGEADFAPSAAAMERTLGLVGGAVSPGPFQLVLSMVREGLRVLSHTGELLSPQPLMVRGAAAVAEAVQPSHTFSQPMPPYQAAVGLEAEGDGRFGVTLTLEEGGEEVPLRATLWEGKRRRAVQSGEGAIHISGLTPGRYRLEIAARGDAVGDIELVVEDGPGPAGAGSPLGAGSGDAGD